jgi:hypothetical protein
VQFLKRTTENTEKYRKNTEREIIPAVQKKKSRTIRVVPDEMAKGVLGERKG